jgi:ABC-type amino acid transport system permease subunit
MFVSFAVLQETGAKGSGYVQFLRKISIGHTLSNAMTTLVLSVLLVLLVYSLTNKTDSTNATNATGFFLDISACFDISNKLIARLS